VVPASYQAQTPKGGTLLSNAALAALLASAALFLPLAAHAATISKPANNLGLVGYWKFDEGAGTKIRDISGNNNAGVLYNATDTPWGAGKYGGAITFDGLNDMVAVPNTPRLQYTGGDMTISLWVKLDVADAGGGFILSKPWNGSGQYNYWLEYVSGPRINLHLQGATVYELTTGIISPGVYHHIVAVVASDATVKIYIDGVLGASGTNTVSNWTPGSGDLHQPLCIGTLFCYGNGWAGITGYSFMGPIDDVRIYNRALTVGEVQALYNTGAARISAAQTSVTNGLVSRWTFDGSDVTDKVYDRVGGNDGYFVGGATSSAKTIGKVGQALSFNGSNNYVNLGNILDMGENNFSISAWARSTSTAVGNNNGIVYKRGTSSSVDKGYRLNMPNGTFNFHIADGINFKTLTAGSTGSYNNGQWHHVVAVADRGTDMRIYVDGVLANTTTETNVGNIDSPIPLAIGSLAAGGATYHPFLGALDDVRIYNRALNASEVKQIYAEGAGAKVNTDTVANTPLTTGLVGYWSFNGPDVTDKIYDRVGGNNGYFIGAATSSAKTIGKLGQALQFNGISSYVQTYPNPVNVGNQMTISVWVKPDAYPNDGQIHEVYRQEELSETTNNYGGYLLSWRGDLNQRWDWGIRQSNVTSKYPYSPTTADVPAGVWTHLVLTADGTNVRGYINGVLKGTVSYDGTISDGRNLIIGAYAAVGGSKARFFPGSIDEMRIYNRALSAAEVKQLYLAGK
jgi:hypothetical protein